MSNNTPIGVFDSGIGGLTVVKEIIKLMPNENIVYFGDTGRAPYGSRPVEQIIEFSRQILNFLTRQDVKIAVVACNTMTMWALEQARSRYSFPLVGTNSGEQLALAATKNKYIGIAATQATINSGKHAARIKAANANARVFPQACPPLVPLVEREELAGAAAEAACRECFQPMKDAGVDTVVLGCTHYPFLLETIKHILGLDVTIIDPAEQTARDAYETLKSMDLLATAGQLAIRHFFFSADPSRAKRLAQRIINIPLPDFQQVDILK